MAVVAVITHSVVVGGRCRLLIIWTPMVTHGCAEVSRLSRFLPALQLRQYSCRHIKLQERMAEDAGKGYRKNVDGAGGCELPLFYATRWIRVTL